MVTFARVRRASGQRDREGTIIVVSGRANAKSRLTLEKGYEIDALDGPMLL